jgi:Alkylmercury lyase
MDDADLVLRNVTYRMFVDHGRAPTIHEVADVAAMSVDDVQRTWLRLAAAHAIVLDDDPAVIRMANPFSAVRTPHRVEAGGRWWYANCAWDAFGICAALHVDGRIESACPDCDEVISIAVRDQRPDDDTVRVHFLVEAAHWWDDIAFT